VLVKEHPRSPERSFACVGRRTNYDFGDWEFGAVLRKGNALVRDHRTSRDAELRRMIFGLERATDDAPLGFLAEPRMLAEGNEN
jgi:hypothetical protein